ncbi:MAG: hypothetical protein Q9207_004197 [Kuettlingeria erythrocarpa]
MHHKRCLMSSQNQDSSRQYSIKKDMKMRARTESFGILSSHFRYAVYRTRSFPLLLFSNAILALLLVIEHLYLRPQLDYLPAYLASPAKSRSSPAQKKYPHSFHVLAMGSGSERAFGEIVEELEAVLELYTDLQTAIGIQSLFESEWLENKVRTKVHQPGPQRSMDRNLRKLAGMGFGDFHEEISMAVIRQKIFLNGDVKMVKEIIDVEVPTGGPYLMHGAMPPPHEANTSDKVYSIQAIGSTTHRVASSVIGLYLIWSNTRKVIECFQGRTNLAQTYPGFTIDPSSITLFERCKENGKVLLESSVGDQKEIPLFVHLAEKDDVNEFFEYLVELAKRLFQCQNVSSQKIDRHVAGFEKA